MKLNSDSSQTNVCKEEVLMCIFKDVPNFCKYMEQDGEVLSVQGSHQDILIGRQCSSVFNTTKEQQKSETTVLDKRLVDAKLQENTHVKLNVRKPKKNLPIGKSAAELQVWSSQSDESLPEKARKVKKSKKGHRQHPPLSTDCSSLTMSGEPLQTPDSERKPQSKKTHSEEKENIPTLRKKSSSLSNLSKNCLWLLQAAKRSESSSSTEDEDDEIMRKLRQSEKMYKKVKSDSLDKSTEKPKDIENYSEEDVLKLLNQVHSRLVASSIILTTQKLKNKIKKSNKDDNNIDGETLSDKNLLEEIETQEGTKGDNFNLCLALGKFVSKYMKIR